MRFRRSQKSTDRKRDEHDLFTYAVAKLGFAALAAFALGSIAHHDLGLSRGEIRLCALILAALAVLSVIVRVGDRKPG